MFDYCVWWFSCLSWVCGLVYFVVGWLYTGWFVCVVAYGLCFGVVLPVFVRWLIVL